MTFPSNSPMRASFASFGFIVALVLASGCAQPSRTRSHSLSQSQATNDIAGHVLDADHIIITNRFATIMEKYRGFRLTISGDEARKIVRAVSSAKRCAPTDSVFDWDLKFYREAHFLADIRLQGSHCVFEGDEYYDMGGVLDHLYHDLLKRTTRPESR